MTTKRTAVLCGIAVLLASAGRATTEMEMQARKLGFPATNCLYCHATPHAVETMKEKAKALNINPGNCLACHGASIPAKLNERGHWLVAEKQRRAAKQLDMAWLRDYRGASPSPAPVARHTRP